MNERILFAIDIIGVDVMVSEIQMGFKLWFISLILVLIVILKTAERREIAKYLYSSGDNIVIVVWEQVLEFFRVNLFLLINILRIDHIQEQVSIHWLYLKQRVSIFIKSTF